MNSISQNENITPIEDRINETKLSLGRKLESLTDQVQEKVESASEAVSSTVDEIKEAFSLKHQVAKHPWIAVVGAVTVGCAAALITRGYIDPNNNPVKPESDDTKETLTQRFKPEINAVKKLAVVSLIGFLIQSVRSMVPQTSEPAVSRIFRDLEQIFVKSE